MALILQRRNSRSAVHLSLDKVGIQLAAPKGSRNKFSEKLLEAFAKDFDRYGEQVIQAVRVERPNEYLRIAASLMPKQMEIEDKRAQRRAEDLSDDELATIAAQSNGAGDHHTSNG